MKRKREKTKIEKLRDKLSAFRLGVDYLALGLFGLFFVLNLVWWCYPTGSSDILRRYEGALGLYIAAFVFLMLAFAVLVFVVRQERERLSIESPFFLFAILGCSLYVAAWIFYFCAYINFAVFLFFAVFPALALVCFALLRKNWLALFPIAIYAALNLASNLILVVAVV